VRRPRAWRNETAASAGRPWSRRALARLLCAAASPGGEGHRALQDRDRLVAPADGAQGGAERNEQIGLVRMKCDSLGEPRDGVFVSSRHKQKIAQVEVDRNQPGSEGAGAEKRLLRRREEPEVLPDTTQRGVRRGEGRIELHGLFERGLRGFGAPLRRNNAPTLACRAAWDGWSRRASR
jgi:hypothetical protein